MGTQNGDFRLKIFLTLAEQGSFTKTAAALGITQPGVSQNISELERIYGMKLFNRDRGSITLTGEGEEFLKYARRIEGAYRDAAAFAENGGTVPGKPEELAVETVRALLPVLRRMNPEFASLIESCCDNFR